MRITITSVFVKDQNEALRFYTELLGFVKQKDIPAGEFKWLTVISPEGSPDIELLLEPNQNPAAVAYQSAIYAQGIPATMFAVTDVQQEYERLQAAGVKFTMPPTPMGPTKIAIFDDTCGNLIQIYEG